MFPGSIVMRDLRTYATHVWLWEGLWIETISTALRYIDPNAAKGGAA